MTGFQAESEAVRALGALLGRQSEHASECGRYIVDNTGVEAGEGWLNQFSGAHDALVDGSHRWFADLSRYTLEGGELAIGDAAEYYGHADAEAAADLDAQLAPASSGPPLPSDPSYYFENRSRAGAFGDVHDVQEQHLVAPEDYAAQDEWRWEMEWTEFLSPSAWGRTVIIEASEILARFNLIDRPYDPYEFLLKPVTGDWGGFRGCADVFRNAAAACRGLAGNLQHGRLGMPAVWTGNAAAACDSYISEICAALGPAVETLEAIADEYETAAMGAFEFAKVIGSILSELIDSASRCVLAAGAGAMTGPVGWAIGGSIALWEAREVAKCIELTLDIWNTAKTAVAGASERLEGFGQLNASGGILPRLPEAGAPGSFALQLPE